MRCVLCLMTLCALTASAAPLPFPPKAVSGRAWEGFGQERARLVLGINRAAAVESNPYGVRYNLFLSSDLHVPTFIEVPLDRATAKNLSAMLLDPKAHGKGPPPGSNGPTLHTLRLWN